MEPASRFLFALSSLSLSLSSLFMVPWSQLALGHRSQGVRRSETRMGGQARNRPTESGSQGLQLPHQGLTTDYYPVPASWSRRHTTATQLPLNCHSNCHSIATQLPLQIYEVFRMRRVLAFKIFWQQKDVCSWECSCRFPHIFAVAIGWQLSGDWSGN